jgi:hypothetical protein
VSQTSWYVLIEHHVNNSYQEWTVKAATSSGDDIAQAREALLDLARRYRPTQPWRPRRRQIFAIGEDSFLVVVTGRMSTRQFRVSLARLVSDEPEATDTLMPTQAEG